ncbi:MAG: GNAT family N-acetyltransferase [Verrucomicrobia bacterium]|nr:GNAT family N-acetyltransferase [Verrucomicrobiota bacterium]
MKRSAVLEFKIATEDWEFDRIHELNYKTFVEEIPQHQAVSNRRLVDKFHSENTYVICLCDGQLIGMLAVRGKRPFSLDQKLSRLEDHLPPGRSICEIRLLAVEKDFRMGQVFYGLLKFASDYCIQQGYDLAVISGTTRQQKLYRHLGFVPFGPLVGAGEALFQPMYLTRESFEEKTKDFFEPDGEESV